MNRKRKVQRQRTDAEIRARYNTDEMIRRHGRDAFGYPKLDMDPNITGKVYRGEYRAKGDE